MTISIIVALGKQNQIGLSNKLPWKLSNDLKNFKKITINNVVIMGIKTFESIGGPLPERINIILSKNKNYKHDGVYIFQTLSKAIEKFKNKDIFICGGEEIYKEALNNKYLVDKLYITEVNYNKKADSFFPKINYKNWHLKQQSFHKADEKNQYDFYFKVFERKI